MNGVSIFEEALVGKIITDRLRDFVTGLDIELHHIAAGDRCKRYFKARPLRWSARYLKAGTGGSFDSFRMRQLFSHQFHFAGGHISIDGVGVAKLHRTGPG